MDLVLTKRSLITVHLWLGLVIGALWSLQGLSGAMLAFNRDIRTVGFPSHSEGSTLPLDDLFEVASAAAGTYVTSLEAFSPQPWFLAAYYKDAQGQSKMLVLDGRSGAVLDRRDLRSVLPPEGDPWRGLTQFHEALFFGKLGSIFIGGSGFLLFTTLILGLWISWPKQGRWRAAFAVGRWRTNSQRLYGYHRMVGLVIGGALLVLVPSGALLAFSPTFEPWLAQAGLFRPPFKAEAVERMMSSEISSQRALSLAHEQFPGAVLVAAKRPTAESPVFTFRLLQDNEWRRWAGTTKVSISPIDGRVLDIYDPLEAPLANQIYEDLYAVHNGDVGGMVGRFVIMFAGLTLPALYVTGVLSWLRRRRRSWLMPRTRR